MLRALGQPLAVRARTSQVRPHTRTLLLVCQSSSTDNSITAPIVERANVNEDDAKVKATISALDAMLGSIDMTTAASSRAPSSSSSITVTPTSSTTSRSPAASPATPSQPFNRTSPADSPSSSSPPPPPSQAPQAGGFTFGQVMGFSGLAPEVVNGRAAMIGFLLAISHELKTGESVFSQLVSGGGLQALMVALVVTAASFAPALRGKPLDEVFNEAPRQPPTEWGPFTAAVEGLHGRLAMLGLALLLFFEGPGNTAFFMN